MRRACHAARESRDAGQVRRLSALAAIYDGASWVRHFETIEELGQALLAFREAYDDHVG
jgi:hypothetical protein